MIKDIEHIAYEGEAYTIEWYLNARLESQALDYYQSLPAKERIKILTLLKRMGDAGKIWDKTKFRSENDKIYAFKPQPDRFLCFFYKGKKIIVTNAFRKQSQKLPAQEKEKALKYRDDYLSRVKKGEYYD